MFEQELDVESIECAHSCETAERHDSTPLHPGCAEVYTLLAIFHAPSNFRSTK